MVHLIKATVGGGFLAMPEAFGNVGWAMGIVGTIVIGLAVLNMMSSIVSTRYALDPREGCWFRRSVCFEPVRT